VIHVDSAMSVEDLGSSNGTRLGGTSLVARRAAPLAPGALLEVGAALVLIQGASESSPREASSREEDEVVVWSDESPIQRLAPLFDLVAAGAMHVLLVGEPGVGKEATAERIHRRSPRAAYPFVRVDCTLGEDDLERDLFGEEKGVRPARPGAIERAQGGSLFLDQVGEMALGVQVKLARALEDKRFARMLGREQRPLDVRVTSASHHAVEPLVAAGRLRRELYNRINGITIAIPSLRERRGDLPLLAQMFVRRACRQLGKREPALGTDALVALTRHVWAGNLRELRQVMERAAVVCTGETITAADLTLHRFGSVALATDPLRGPSAPPAQTRATLPGVPEKAADPEALALNNDTPPPAATSDLRATERRLILDALDQSRGNQTRAAEILGMSRRTLSRKIGTMNDPPPSSEPILAAPAAKATTRRRGPASNPNR
jgi:two-component system response regulator AtoC